MINVTKTYLPDIDKYKSYIDEIYANGQLTNNGPLVQKLERRLQEYLGVNNVILVANGTLALDAAYRALDLTGDVITTPFSFVATVSSIVSSGLNPLFSDISPRTLNIDASLIEKKITSKTSAIVPVHVFGNVCEVERIKSIADKHNLKIIYDAAHAFGVKYKGQSVLNYGDISTLSFHATKLFHTIEGGAVIASNDELARKIRLQINFGIAGEGAIESLGINAKMNEVEAAMGLCMLDEMENIKTKRKEICKIYKENLTGIVNFSQQSKNTTQNYSYFPIILKDEKQTLKIQKALNNKQIFPRRYFYPSLDTLKYIESEQFMSKSRDISSRILCLPLYPELSSKDLQKIIATIKKERI
jgi:dTDP-4-amino-4,6-dideoxygalactose transaminase